MINLPDILERKQDFFLHAQLVQTSGCSWVELSMMSREPPELGFESHYRYVHEYESSW